MTDVLLDLIPCEVQLPDGRFVRRARVWVTSHGVVVYSEVTPNAVAHEYAARHASTPELDDTRKPKRRQAHVVHTADGDVTIRPVLGCLCGFPGLRGYTYDQVQLEHRTGVGV